jgi:hypothetical protein
MTKSPLPPSLRDGQYRNWEIEMAARYPLALSEMRAPSAPLDTFETRALARWGLEVHAGWRGLTERLLEKLQRAITAQPTDERDRFRIVQLKEKFGSLTVYLATKGTPEMEAAIHDAREESATICDVCSAPGQLAERGPLGWWSTRCPDHETWTPADRFT